MKTSGKLKYLNDILKYYDEYNSILENKNVPMIDTSNVPVYQEEFYTMFPVISVRSKRDDLKRTNENCLDLNMILKYFAIISGYTFDNKNFNEDMTAFKYTNQNHLANNTLLYNRFYSLSPLTIIFCLAKSEYQAWLTTYCLYKSMKILPSYFIYNAYYYDRNKTKNSWTKSIFTCSCHFLYHGIFLPEYRNEAKKIYKLFINGKEPLNKNDTQRNVKEYFKRTNNYTYNYETTNNKYERTYLEIMYFIMMNDYDFFSLCIKALTQRELNAQIHKILTGQEYIEDYLYPLKSLIFYFKVSKHTAEFFDRFLKHANSDFAFKLLCLLDNKYNEEVVSKAFNTINKSTYCLRNNLIYKLAEKLKIDYPNNNELEKFISKKLALELAEI